MATIPLDKKHLPRIISTAMIDDLQALINSEPYFQPGPGRFPRPKWTQARVILDILTPEYTRDGIRHSPDYPRLFLGAALGMHRAHRETTTVESFGGDTEGLLCGERDSVERITGLDLFGAFLALRECRPGTGRIITR